MCRLFGFRSVIPSQVHQSLLHADNALMQQSSLHPDGWGVSYYEAGAPHVVKSCTLAIEDKLFQKVSGVVSSNTVLAHIRKATLGPKTIVNCHPFQYGKWTFAHNGNIREFAKVRSKLEDLIKPRFRRFILGETDSEILFYLILTHVSEKVDLIQKDVPLNDVLAAVKKAVNEITAITGDYKKEDGSDPSDTYLTFILTNGNLMVGHQGGKPLLYSTYKTKCSQRDTCSYYSKECENPTQSGYINHLVLTSEKIKGENVWIPLKPGEVVGVDSRMHFKVV